MNDKYILDSNGNPVQEPDLKKWAEWYGSADRRVAWTEIGDARISTVFLGLNHNWNRYPNAKPILYETMIFWPNHELDNNDCRYFTREEALTGHEVMVALVKAASKAP